MRTLRTGATLVFVVGVLTAGGIQAQVSGATRALTYEGYLDLHGAPVDALEVDFTFELYEAEAEGDPLWSSGTVVLPVSSGRFAIELGSAEDNPLPDVLWELPGVYLAIAVEGTPLLGRQRIGVSPYSVRAVEVRLDTVAEDCDESRIGQIRIGETLERCGHLTVYPSGSPVDAGLFWLGDVPPGTLTAFAADAPPAGWLVCDGRGLRSAEYPALFATIGTRWGDGTSSCSAGGCNFNLPDLRGRFLRGADAGAARDPSRDARTASNPGGAAGDAVGTVQLDSLQEHTVQTGVDGNAGGYSLGGSGNQSGGFGFENNTGSLRPIVNGGTAIRVSAETRPLNAAVTWIIHY